MSGASGLRKHGHTSAGDGGTITPTVADDSVTNAKLRDSAAVSVIGRSANSTGDPADIAAGSDGHYLRRAASAVGFGAIVDADLPSTITRDSEVPTLAAALRLDELAAPTADVDLNGEKIINLDTPTNPDDAANKAYVDGVAAGGGIAVTLADDAGDTLVASAADTWTKRKNNPGAAVAPAVTDDSGDGYSIGSRWYDTTADREYVALDVSVGAAVWKDTTAAGSFDEDLLPWTIDIVPWLTGITQTNWNLLTADATSIGGFIRQSSGAQNAEIGWDVVLADGTWTVELMHLTTADVGIYSVQFDAVEKGTVDGYAAAAVRNVRTAVTGITVGTSAKIRLTLKMATKHASSSSYKGNLGGIQLRRTA